jgi:hypothetical protein
MIKHLCMTVLAVMLAGSTALGHAQEATIDKAAADAFDARIFTGPPERRPMRASCGTTTRIISPGTRSRKCPPCNSWYGRNPA